MVAYTAWLEESLQQEIDVSAQVAANAAETIAEVEADVAGHGKAADRSKGKGKGKGKGKSKTTAQAMSYTRTSDVDGTPRLYHTRSAPCVPIVPNHPPLLNDVIMQGPS